MTDSRQDRSELLTRWGLPLVMLAFFVATALGYVDHPLLPALIAWPARTAPVATPRQRRRFTNASSSPRAAA